MSFDPVQYKTTTRQQWEHAAEGWHLRRPTLESWLGSATDRVGPSALLVASGVR